MKNLFTGVWVFALAALAMYFMFRYVAHPLILFIDKESGEPTDPTGAIALAIVVSIFFLALSALFLLALYKIGEAINNR